MGVAAHHVLPKPQPIGLLYLLYVQLREVLEKFLDDDSDMKDLNLTAKVG